MIYTEISSGLGNQLFQYAVARQLSIKNNTSLKLDISFFDNQNLRNYKLHNYNINATIADKIEIDNFLSIYSRDVLYAKLYRRIEKKIPKYFRKYYSETQWWVYEAELSKVANNTYLKGYWQHYKYFQKIDSGIFNELTPKNDEYNNYSITHTILQDTASVSIHIRRGDYITDTAANDLMGTLPLEYYKSAIKYLKEQLIAPFFYIFSDDLEWAKDNLNLGNSAQYIDIANGGKDYIELYLMSKCRHNIIANSSFSWWGAFLNQNKEKIVIAPAQWVKSDLMNSKVEIQCPSWIKM
ncbi:alpha-1,2-fucosyltransferase [Mucilaginibacter sp. L196]|uniref:alpha-1,2-fucosyltransferase n=1 Tax=Mucilaginibacter sp. L196 TaxID=1641870 RepID=UPI00131B1DF2|nr:alpha-1,2-fucosyltransferase [Mucilaginibacter sp. L196]